MADSALLSTIDLARSVFTTIRTEDAVREAIVGPLLAALGYHYGSVFGAELGVRFAASQLNRTGGRHHVAPDIVLVVDDRPVWVIETKAPGKRLTLKIYTEQLASYLRSFQGRCDWGVLTDGMQWDFYALRAGRLRRIQSLNLAAGRRRAGAARALRRALDPARSYLRGLSDPEILDVYRGGDWIVRNMCMELMSAKSLRARRKLRPLFDDWHRSPTVRERSLPAILLLDDPDIGAQIFERAMNDPKDTVRDTAFTIVRSLAMKRDDYRVAMPFDNVVPDGWFSRIVFIQMLSALLITRSAAPASRGALERQILTLETDPDPLVRQFARIGLRGILTPFPFAAFTHRPRFAVGQSEIDAAMIAATIRMAVDPAYASESQTSARDAVRHARLSHDYVRGLLPARDRLLFEDLVGEVGGGVPGVARRGRPD